jgi:hypothetical protein
MLKPVVGKKYKIRYRSGLQRLDREAVMRYLGESSWDARPAAGTQELYLQDIKDLIEVSDNTENYLNRIAKE